MLGTAFTYDEPQLAGGARASAAEYGAFLQRIVGGQLLMRDALGTHAVCTNPQTCPTAVYTPMSPTESPHYSIGHWVEDDPVMGDGAFSSAGAFGFYPWIDRTKTWWGVISRFDAGVRSEPGPGVESLYCGRDIRAAWVSGQARATGR
jgi:CubicO group peptidase (beta-lactamase class C family)